MSSAVLERRLSVQDVRDAPPLAAYNHSPHVPEATRYIPRLSPLYRRAPVRFSIQPTMQDTFECSPGSIFQGTIHLQLAEPLAAQHLKLSFRGLERLNYDAMGWGRTRKQAVIFSVRLLVWGQPPSATTWPVLESGIHFFPFWCEMPMVNYATTCSRPHTSQEPYQTVMELVASLERPGDRPFQTEPCYVSFRPVVPTPPIPRPLQDTHAWVRLVSVSPTAIRVDILDASLEKYTIGMALHCQSKITTSGFRHLKTAVVARTEKSHVRHLALALPHRLSPTLTYAKHLQVHYSLHIFASKKRHLTKKRKRSVVLPIVLGTLPVGEPAPANVLPFTHPSVLEDTTPFTKPRLFRSSLDAIDHPLPPYDEAKPPSYVSL